MSELNENQLLLLDNLIYLEGVAVEGQKAIPVKQIIDNLLDDGGLEQSFNEEAIVKADEYPVLISYDRWRGILTNIKNDPTLMSVTLTNPRNQIITKPVNGHSKGGNKAQYVSILSNKIDRCVSFDGQGFSKEFIDKHKDKIATNRHKVTSISASSDYVNCLHFSVSGKQRYIETESEGKDFMHFHCSDIVLKLDGDLRDDTEQSATSKLINKFTEYVMVNVKEPERSYVINGLVVKFEGKDTDESPEQQKIIIYA